MLKFLRGWALTLTLLAPSLAYAGPDQMPPDSYVHITNPSDVSGGGGTTNNINNNTTTSSTTINNSTTNNNAGGAVSVTLVPPGGGNLTSSYFGSHPISNNPVPLGTMSISGPVKFGAYQLNVTPDGHAQVDVTDKSTCTGVHFLSAANTNNFVIRSAPGALCGVIEVTNSGSTTGGYLRFYDTATNPTCSSAAGIIMTVQVPVNATAANIAGIVIPIPRPIRFSNGLGVCLTGAFSDTDTTNFVTGTAVSLGVQ